MLGRIRWNALKLKSTYGRLYLGRIKCIADALAFRTKIYISHPQNSKHFACILTRYVENPSKRATIVLIILYLVAGVGFRLKIPLLGNVT